MSSDDGEPVDLYVYDLTHGMASVLSPAILGHKIEGVWHTSIVVFGTEYFYGGSGINTCVPESTQLGAPLQRARLGRTHVPRDLFDEYVRALAGTLYAGSQYNLLQHNCNNFTEELAQFLCGVHIPKHILELPERALTPPLRAALQMLLEQMLPAPTAQSSFGARHLRQDSPDYVTLNTQIEEARATGQQLEQRRTTLAEKLARKERRKEKKRKKMMTNSGDAADDDTMSEVAEVAAGVAGGAVAGPSSEEREGVGEGEGEGEVEREEKRREEELRRAREPPIIYRDLDPETEMSSLESRLADTEAGAAEALRELRAYLVEGEGSWALGDEWGEWAGTVLAAQGDAAAALMRCLACAALRDDVSLLLHQDRRSHALTNYAHRIDRLALPEQQAVALFMCNLFENVSSSEWLLYISEWEVDGHPLSNIRVTTKVAVHALLSEDERLREVGSALMHNIAIKEVKTVVFDDVSVELAMALLQFVSSSPSEEPLYRACRALARLALHSADVPQLLAMLAVQPDTFRGKSPRIDEQIDILMTKVK